MAENIGTISIRGNRISFRVNGQAPQFQGTDSCPDPDVECGLIVMGVDTQMLVMGFNTPLDGFCLGLSGIASETGQTIDQSQCEAEMALIEKAAPGYSPIFLNHMVRNGLVDIVGAQIPLNDLLLQVDNSARQSRENRQPESDSLGSIITGAVLAVALIGTAVHYFAKKVSNARKAAVLTASLKDQPSPPATVRHVDRSLISTNKSLLILEGDIPTPMQVEFAAVEKEFAYLEDMKARLDTMTPFMANEGYVGREDYRMLKEQIYQESLKKERKLLALKIKYNLLSNIS